MGKKYIIEVEDEEVSFDHGLFMHMEVCGIEQTLFTGYRLTPYTEPDTDKIRKEAYTEAKIDAGQEYENGYDAGHNVGYQQGLSDAWEAARKIAISEESGGLTCREMQRIFCTDETDEIFDMSASEVIEKIRQYEQEQKQLHVGDEVNAPFGKAIVVNIDSVAEKIWLVYADGHGGFEYFKDAPTKTGMSYPEVAKALERMK